MPIIDDFSQEIILKLLCLKDEAFKHYLQHEAFMKGHCGVIRISTLRTNCGGEYTSDTFESHLRDEGMVHEKTVHDLSAQNGTAEWFL